MERTMAILTGIEQASGLICSRDDNDNNDERIMQKITLIYTYFQTRNKQFIKYVPQNKK
jgi:hypothetical protein